LVNSSTSPFKLIVLKTLSNALTCKKGWKKPWEKLEIIYLIGHTILWELINLRLSAVGGLIRTGMESGF
jgi:hypothetical protein